MTDLKQQLEDKKKELESLEHPDCMGNWEENQGQKHEICKAEIAILEQAIAEIKSKDANVWRFICTNCKKESITDLRGKEKYLCYECALQKQRQDFERILNRIIGKLEDGRNQREEITDYCKDKKQQLNQPKEKKR